VVVDGTPWAESFDMVWPPVFSPDGRHVAARVKQADRWRIVVDGRPLPEAYTTAWDPVFSPDGKYLLVRAVEGSGAEAVCQRLVRPLNDIRG
jgi:hypothetical protein